MNFSRYFSILHVSSTTLPIRSLYAALLLELKRADFSFILLFVYAFSFHFGFHGRIKSHKLEKIGFHGQNKTKRSPRRGGTLSLLYQMFSKLFCRSLFLEKKGLWVKILCWTLFKLAAIIFINNLAHHLLILLKKRKYDLRCRLVLRKLAESGAQAAKLGLLLLFQPVFTEFKRWLGPKLSTNFWHTSEGCERSEKTEIMLYKVFGLAHVLFDIIEDPTPGFNRFAFIWVFC